MEKQNEICRKTRRELFEAWALTDAWLGLGEEPERFEGGYLEFETHAAWLAFNAALDAIEIELPKPSGMLIDARYYSGVSDSRSCIESLNLGIKIK